MTAKYVEARPRTVETGLLRDPLLWWLCVGDTCRRIFQSCPNKTALFCNFVQQQLKNSFFVSVWTEAFVHQITHTLWRFQQPRRACPSSWSLAPLSRVWLQKRCLFPRRNTHSAEGLHPPCSRSQTEVVGHHCVDFRLFSMWRVASSGFDAHFAQRLTREMCQTVLIQHDLIKVPASLRVAGRDGIGSSTSSSACGPIGICNY